MSKHRSVRIATDVGGTFTDLVAFYTDPDSGEQTAITAKSDTTPPNFEQGVLRVIEKAGVDLGDVSTLAHGTTVVINALTERKGAKTALITTEGFRDVLEIARGNRPDFFNLHYRKPQPFVPRKFRFEVPGRLTPDGEERIPLDVSRIPEIAQALRDGGIEAVAVCLLHSYANPEHEIAVVDALREAWPEGTIVASHQITRQWREYERSSTAVLSAFVQPTAEKYLTKLEDGLASAGFDGSLYVMQSNGGVDKVSHTKQIPITMVESGPASGFLGAAALGQLVGEPNVLALDIGGTTAKCSLIEDGLVKVMTDYWIERSRTSAGYPIMVPVIDLVEIGNGGGSIGWVDDFGKLHVGPQSAGSTPGPAAYGKSGKDATTTDANLALGRINAEYFVGGEVEADLASVDKALASLAAQLEMSNDDVARGIVRIANNNMINALKLVSLNRGHDPRDFTLVAFGGGGAMHACDLAAELGMKKVIVPNAAEVFSAWGMLMGDLRRDLFLTRLLPLISENMGAIEQLIADSEAQMRNEFEADDVAGEAVSFKRFAELRYVNQEHSVEVELPSEVGSSTLEQLLEHFHAEYEREYTYRLDAPVEFVGLHLIAMADVGKLEPQRLDRTGATIKEARKASREVDFLEHGVHEAQIIDGQKLEPGMEFVGPAIVEYRGTTAVIPPRNDTIVDDYGNLHITINAKERNGD
ncbi:hydantoinase/oxoprolinase family protein [Corynebacterium sp. Marseille-P4321]|uniref:hydantoinase/oxoprolinase family protein n=1 Tax=Corynebacterium sp. Marseille-P4321 TaxID=2736603 RepID=UPI001589B2D0|nr:hydantoinase/oxoprolinase family protein [Corynebacterium sp. Marseille-P4321]